MLLNSFFQIKEISTEAASEKIAIKGHLTINKTHPLFQGHFPHVPVVPGVCMIEMIKEILENHLSKKLFLTTASNIKFLSVINPEINNELNIEINYTTSNYAVDASLFWGDITFFKIKGIFSTSLY